jgi:shikimate kinase|tara:strand:+ start:37 stop:549 length:513 start_codon:yes stop_codon:yes gene_type:complete
MKSNKNIVLLGMMGSGKSTIGYLLSNKINSDFYDIDKIIEEEEGLKITEIFENKGENYFRKIEEKICLKILKFNKKIISLGGGSFLNNKIREEIQNNHVSFWLNWNTSTIIRRIKKNKNRPILKGMSENEINKLIIKRKKIYEKAHLKINCENLSKNEIINKIIKLYEGK